MWAAHELANNNNKLRTAIIPAATTTTRTTKLKKICSCCSPLGNVAYNKPTVQTEDFYDFTSDRAVDGITDYPDCAATDAVDVWWRVDLGQLYRIYSVTLDTGE